LGNQDPDYSGTPHGTRRFTGRKVAKKDQVPFPAGCPPYLSPLPSRERRETGTLFSSPAKTAHSSWQ